MAEEHTAPEQVTPEHLGDYLEVMSKSVFQTGISWKVVNAKWPGIRDAFRGFDATAVASLTEGEIAELAQDTRIIRNRKKVDAIVDNARRMIELDEEHRGFQQYLRSQGDFRGHGEGLAQELSFPRRHGSLRVPVRGWGAGAGIRGLVPLAGTRAFPLSRVCWWAFGYTPARDISSLPDVP
jgi:3-methyladenine DNA glycosylase Tag